MFALLCLTDQGLWICVAISMPYTVAALSLPNQTIWYDSYMTQIPVCACVCVCVCRCEDGISKRSVAGKRDERRSPVSKVCHFVFVPHLHLTVSDCADDSFSLHHRFEPCDDLNSFKALRRWVLLRQRKKCGSWWFDSLIAPIIFNRHGHALAMAANVAFVFGGASSINQEVTLKHALKHSFNLDLTNRSLLHFHKH